MNKSEIEAVALDAIERVRLGQHVEDDRIELKAEWPAEHHGAARRIAGHANASRHQPIIWIIGLDEKRGVVGVERNDYESWHAKVSRHFEGYAPEPLLLCVSVEGKTVAVLYYETDRPPYLVKNEHGGAIQFEVPWREATGIKTANRAQLLKVLIPTSRLPRLVPLTADLTGQIWREPGVEINRSYIAWDMEIGFFLDQSPSQSLNIGHHQLSAQLIICGNHIVTFQSGGFHNMANPTAESTARILKATGSTYFTTQLYRLRTTNIPFDDTDGDARAKFTVNLSEFDIPIVSEFNLRPATLEANQLRRWSISRQSQ
jgi:hypothetical protein